MNVRIGWGWLWCSLAFGSALGAYWHEGHHGTKKSRFALPAESHIPKGMPDRIILTFAGDPRFTQAVTWRTSTEVKAALAEIAIATPGPEFAAMARQVPATTEHLQSDLSEAHYHSVVFRQLSPGTTYCYRVGDGTQWSEWFQFSTAKETPEAFSFIYFGDAQNDVRSMWSRVIRQAQKQAPGAKFLVHAGDLINSAESDSEWGDWFGAGGWMNGMIPSMPVVGNHEMAKIDDEHRRLSKHWQPQFTLPKDGPKGLEETCYCFEYQDTLMIALNSNERFEEQAKWLEQQLSQNTKRWIVCVFHHPLFSAAKARDNAELRATWKPILDKYRVDLVLQGHDHSYARSGAGFDDSPEGDRKPPITLGNVATGVTHVEEEVGTVYVVSVSGPKMYPAQPRQTMKKVGEDTQLYQVIQIDGDTLTFEARTANGELYDAFALRKTVGQPNRILEKGQEIPERRRPPTEK